MRRITRLPATLWASVVVAGITVGIVLAVGVAFGSDRQGANANHRRQHQAVQRAEILASDIASSYGFLTASSSVQLPASLASDLGPAAGAVTPTLAREAGSVGGQRLWFVPGSSESCIEVDSGASACGSNAFAERQGLWIILRPVSGAAPTEYGIIPDGATVSGDATSAAITTAGNGVMVTPRSSAPGTFAIHTAGGSSVDMSVPPATGEPQ